MPLERRHARIPAAIAIVALAAFAILWIGARMPFVRGMVAGWISDATGLPAAIESLSIGFLPSPSVVIRGVTIAQPAGFGGEPFATVGRIHVRIPWSEIFRITEVSELAAEDLTVRLVVDAAGVANWSKLGGEPAASAAASRAEAPAQHPADWALGSLKLERGTIDYRNLATGSAWQLAAIAIDADGVGPAQAFPFDVKLGGVAGPNTFHFSAAGEGRADTAAGAYEAKSLEFRGWLGGEPLPLAGAELTGALARASFDMRERTATVDGGRFRFAEVPGTFQGRAELDGAQGEAIIEVATETFEPRAPAIILGRPLPTTADPAVFGSLQLALVARLQDGGLRLDPVNGQLDDTKFEASLVPAERRVRAALDRIHLDRYLKATTPSVPTAAPPKPKATLEAAATELAKLDIDAEIRVGEARVAGAVLRDAVIRVEREASAP